MKKIKCYCCSISHYSQFCITLHKVVHKKEKDVSGESCCTICGKRFSNNEIFEIHLSHHGVWAEGRNLGLPGKSYRTSNALNRIRRRNSKGRTAFGMSSVLHRNPILLRIRLKARRFFALNGQLRYSGQDRLRKIVQNIKYCKILRRRATRDKLAIHIETHTEEKPFSCNVCRYQFHSKVLLNRHLKTHSGEKLFMCEHCGKIFQRKHTLTIHLRGHSGEKHFSCDTCGKWFVSKSNLDAHLKTHLQKVPFSCEICGKNLKLKSSLARHLRTHTTDVCFPCDTCGKQFRSKCSLTKHSKKHSGEKPYSCDLCGKSFVHKYVLTQHLLIHSEEKPFGCETCGKTFLRKESLLIHSRVHSGEKPFSCVKCGKRFPFYSGLCKHLKSHSRVVVKERCETCGKEYKSKNSLNKHLQVHTAEMGAVSDTSENLIIFSTVFNDRLKAPFRCETCKRGFTSYTDLTNHLKVHTEKNLLDNECGQTFDSLDTLIEDSSASQTNELQFCCETCGETFQYEQDLISHSNSVHTTTKFIDKPFSCATCGESFRWWSHLDEHLSTHSTELSIAH